MTAKCTVPPFGWQCSRESGHEGPCAATLLYVGNFDAMFGTIPISDKEIESAPYFEGWQPCYLDWPKELWANPERGVPCEDVMKNAYHIRRCADAMRQSGRWVGNKLMARASGLIVDANHRARAVQYLKLVHKIDIVVPVRRCA